MGRSVIPLIKITCGLIRQELIVTFKKSIRSRIENIIYQLSPGALIKLEFTATQILKIRKSINTINKKLPD
jgi:hypothetical protein